MRLLEIVRGATTGKDVLASAMALAKQPQEDGRGGGRLRRLHRQPHGRQYTRQAGCCWTRAPAAAGGRALEHFGLAMGPFRMADLAGNDAVVHPSPPLRRAPGRASTRPPPTAGEAGRFGQKTGAGWYDYRAGDRARLPDPEVEDIIAGAFARPRHDPPRHRRRGDRRALRLSRSSTRARTSSRRASRCAPRTSTWSTSPATASRRYRGGPMFYADTVGLANVLNAALPPSSRPIPAIWQPAPLLVRLASEEHEIQWVAKSNDDAVIVSTARTPLCKTLARRAQHDPRRHDGRPRGAARAGARPARARRKSRTSMMGCAIPRAPPAATSRAR